jgi:hypothetical protein
MGALTDLDVDRVDAVDRPATGRKFLIRKAEGDGAPSDGEGLSEAKRLLSAAVKALGAVRKTETAATLDEEQITALNELRDVLGDEGGEPFAKSEAKPPETPAAPTVTSGEGAPAAATAAPAQPFDMKAFAEALAEPIAKAVSAGIAKAVEEDGPEDEDADSTVPPSAQPAGQTAITKRSATPKFGEGMFASVIHQRSGRY